LPAIASQTAWKFADQICSELVSSVRSQASWCELMALMAVRAPTVNRDLAGAARASHQ